MRQPAVGLSYPGIMAATRREFLTAMAVAAAAPFPQLERFTARGPSQRIIVLGAGLAGLCAAYELQASDTRCSCPKGR